MSAVGWEWPGRNNKLEGTADTDMLFYKHLDRCSLEYYKQPIHKIEEWLIDGFHDGWKRETEGASHIGDALNFHSTLVFFHKFFADF